MEQLPLPLPNFRQSYPEIVGPKCPCCRQALLTPEQRLVVWQSIRSWILLNWDLAMLELLRHQAHHPQRLNLAEHPDLLWALEADAREHGLTPSDRLAEILDSFFQGEFNEILRRGLKKPSWSYALARGYVFAYRSDRPWAGRPDKHSVFLGCAPNKGKADRVFRAWLKKTKAEITAPETLIGSGHEAV